MTFPAKLTSRELAANLQELLDSSPCETTPRNSPMVVRASQDDAIKEVLSGRWLLISRDKAEQIRDALLAGAEGET